MLALYNKILNFISKSIGTVSSSGCPLETDPYWNITWKPTLAGMTDTQKCPSGTIG